MPNIRETISQVLSPTSATYVNGVSVKRDFSKAVLGSLYQGLIEKDGRGVSNKFITEEEANRAGQVFVNRLLPHNQKPREHGAAKNGGAFSNTGYMPATETVGIDILTLLDDPIIIPTIAQDRIDLDLVVGETENFVKYINVVLNGASFGAKWIATYNAAENKRNVQKITSTDITNKVVLYRFQEANSKLDMGDRDHSIDVFPLESRLATFKMSYRPTLIAGGVLVIGGANYGYDIARKGALDAGSDIRTLDDGFWGVVDNVPVHGISNQSLIQAAWFCGMPDYEFIDDAHLVGWISSGYANARGVSMVKEIKIVDARGGQGLELQPLVKVGAVAWYPKGNVAITTADYDPIADLKTLFAGKDLSFKLKGGASRYYSDDLTISAISTTAFTFTGTAKDDANTDHLEGGYYCVGDDAIATVGAFIDAANASGAEAGACVAGTSKSFSATQTAGKYLTVLAIGDDGTCTLVSKVIPS